MKKYIIFIVLLIIPEICLSSSSLYVQSKKANLLDQPSFKGQLLESLSKGTQVDSIETRGNWIKVQHKKQVGWISKLLLATNPPQQKASLLQGQEQQLKNNARRRASENTTAAATRGLRSEDRSRISDENNADYRALEKVESEKVSDDDTKAFHKELTNKKQ